MRYATLNFRITQLALAGVLAALTASCRDTQGPGVVNPPLLPSLIVSNPGGTAGSSARSPSARLADLVYTSLPPGSFPEGERIVIENRKTGAQVTAMMSNGGVDPLSLAAAIGDTLDIRIQLVDNSKILEFISLVPLLRPPVVVRTDPPPGKRDVPLNSIMVLVFSEPIKDVSAGDAVQLLENGASVAGTVEFAGTDQLVVTFTPSQPLLPDASYTVRLTQAIEDLGGESLASEVTIPFETGSDASGGSGIYLADANGLSASWLVRGNRPAWSPDGQRIAFEQLGEIRVINVDGSNEALITQGTEPSWSPDGTHLVLVTGGGISVVDLATKATTQLIAPNFDPRVVDAWGLAKPDWSPDGRLIAFEHYGDDNTPAQVYVMNANGSLPYRLSNTPGRMVAESDPAWSADGAWIVYWSYDLGIAFADPVGSSSTSVYLNFPFIAYGARPDFSPNGNAILFSNYDRNNLYVISRNGAGFRRLIPDAYHGTWSPDGNRIAFVRGAP